MSRKIDCAIYRDLYELYTEGEVEEATVEWMKEHERSCVECSENSVNGAKIIPHEEDYQRIKSIRYLTIGMYGCFIVISLWMSIWYFL
jgi:predicted anti-sigma-YlaC factor YlaD